MVDKDEHKAYVDKLVKLQDKDGKDLSSAFLSIFGGMAKASKGDVRKLLAMIKLSRKKLIRDAVEMVKESQDKAKELGKEFGALKLNAVESETSQ